MTATQRTIAEIIGWEKRATPFYRAPGETVARKPTPDDLLAWLREQRWVASIMTWRDIEDVRVDIMGSYGEQHHELHAPTLLAALEAAVRVVAGES